ncbi:MAG: hypothetical protein K0Q87_4608, partial [Neobacillus sp.]|nr:hypothetical protein [Neobacillus sp.]
IAASEGNIDIVRYLVDQKAVIDTVCEDDGNSTPLIVASVYNYPEIVNVLALSGADTELKDDEGRTALFNAAIARNTDVIRILLKYNANQNVVDYSGKKLENILKKIELD